MHVFEANGKAQVDAVVDVAAEVDAIFSDIARLSTIERVVVGIDCIDNTFFVLNHT